jgi:hypothetical protein
MGMFLFLAGADPRTTLRVIFSVAIAELGDQPVAASPSHMAPSLEASKFFANSSESVEHLIRPNHSPALRPTAGSAWGK